MTLKKRSVADGNGAVLPLPPLSVDAASYVASAREVYLRGDHEQCVSMLQGRTFEDARLRAEAAFILARALLRLQRAPEVVDLLEPVLTTFTTVDEVCTARMLHGMAVALAQDVDRGLELLAAVAAIGDAKRADRAIRAEIAYSRGLAHWTKHEYREASRYATLAERAKVDVLSVRAMQLRAFAALACNDYRQALRLFHRAREAYAMCRGRDIGLATQIIVQIAFLEMNLRSAKVPGSHANPTSRTVPGSSFGPAVATSTFMLLISAHAWLYAHDGDRVTAIRKVHDAIAIAPTAAWRVWGFSSGATLFHAFGETGNARVFADNAAKLASSVDWTATTDEERVGLLWLAEVCAAINPAAAPEILERYDAVTSTMDPTRVLRDRDADPRLAAWDAFVRGLVARGVGDLERAGRFFRMAAGLFGSCDHLWREALALIELDATPIDTRGEVPLERAAIIIRDNFPHSFLARRLGPFGRAYVDPVARTLTPAQRDVLRRLLEGKSPAQIARVTNRASTTVYKHMANIRVAFGAHTERELFAECYRRGLGALEWSLPSEPALPAKIS